MLADHLVALVVLGREVEGLGLDAHIDVLADQDHPAFWAGGLHLLGHR